MTMLTITAEDGSIARLAEKFARSTTIWESATVAWADTAGPVEVRELMSRSPVKSGRLRDSFRYQRTTLPGEVRLEFHTNVPYFPFVVNPTRPHIIQPVAAQALRWHDSGGTEFFAKLVHHPGTKGNDFPQRTLNETKAELTVTYLEVLRKAYTVL